jgi:hypothetical protein
MFDIAIPDGNEKEFIKMGKRVGLDGLIFLYKKQTDFKDPYVKVAYMEKGQGMVFSRKEFKDVAYDFEDTQKKDKTHYRKSGYNQVGAKEMKEKGTMYAFNFSKAKNPIILGRMMQNARLCKKYGVKTIVASFATKPLGLKAKAELEAFDRILGLQSEKKI